MSIIRIWLAKLGNYFRGLMATRCTNCGATSDEVAMLRCRMRDRCIYSQNMEIIARSKDDELVDSLRVGGRPFVDSARPLCVRCADASKYVCYICELEYSEEARK
jgi:hypothetical protein